MFLLILKKTSSPVDVTTYESDTAGEKDAKLGQKFSAFIGRIVPLGFRERGNTLMLIGALSSVFTCSGFGSVSDMVWRLPVDVGEVKYQETPSAAAMVAEGERRV